MHGTHISNAGLQHFALLLIYTKTSHPSATQSLLASVLATASGHHANQTSGLGSPKLLMRHAQKLLERVLVPCLSNGFWPRRLTIRIIFHPQHPSLVILVSELVSERKVLTKETGFSLVKERNPGNCSRSNFCTDQVLFNKNFHSRLGCRRKILSKEFWGCGWGSKFDPQTTPFWGWGGGG